MWDEEDGFYYDVLRLPDGTAHGLKVRSIVGLLPLCAATVFEQEQRERVPTRRHPGALAPHAPTAATMHPIGPAHLGVADADSRARQP